ALRQLHSFPTRRSSDLPSAIPCGSQRTLRSYRTPMPLEPGLVGDVLAAVSDDDTALALGSGDVPVLGTPRVVALAEEASLKAIRSEEHTSELQSRFDLV